MDEGIVRPVSRPVNACEKKINACERAAVHTTSSRRQGRKARGRGAQGAARCPAAGALCMPATLVAQLLLRRLSRSLCVLALSRCARCSTLPRRYSCVHGWHRGAHSALLLHLALAASLGSQLSPGTMMAASVTT
jgi:hypothetical protein